MDLLLLASFAFAVTSFLIGFSAVTTERDKKIVAIVNGAGTWIGAIKHYKSTCACTSIFFIDLKWRTANIQI